jgi:mono/diheme cytochrome c family protein
MAGHILGRLAGRTNGTEQGWTVTRGIAIGLGIISICVMGLTVGAWQGPGQAGRSAAETAAAKALKNPAPADAASIDAGRVVYQKFCQSCHGPEGKGDGPAGANLKPADFTDAKWEHGGSDGEIFTTIKTGVGPKFDMDSWDGRIQDREIWNVVNYLKTLSKSAAPAAR